jgi:hypothetical protein
MPIKKSFCPGAAGSVFSLWLALVASEYGGLVEGDRIIGRAAQKIE